ncbi:MAG: V-type ATP synthase subunit D [Candidatus Kariarchaeaceae archaeon]
MSETVEGVNATRMALLETRERVRLAENGHDLLKEKMDALIMELYNFIDISRTIQDEVNSQLKEAFNNILLAQLDQGMTDIQDIANSAPARISLHATNRSIMGVQIPNLAIEFQESNSPFYSLINTRPQLDSAIYSFAEALKTIMSYAENIAAITRIAGEIGSTKRRVNALNHVVIPNLKATVSYINNTLQEQERDNFSRLKHIKRALNEKKQA